MKPLIHHVYTIKDYKPDKKIATIVGKAKFRDWGLEYFLDKDSEGRICFQIEGWEKDYFLEPLPFVKMRGKNVGEPRLVFVRLRKPEDDEDVPF